jgi:hypothetical protein
MAGRRSVLWLCVPILLLASTPSWADSINLPTFDANKLAPIPANDLSCWIASAANMLAADDWDNNNVSDLYTKLKSNAAFQNGTGWRGGFQDQALTYALSGANNFQFLPGYDATEQIDIYNSWRKAWPLADSPRTIITKLLAESTADPADDPVGIAFHGNNIAHAVTAWGYKGDAAAPTQLGITDSDDGVNGVVYYNWIDGFTLNYNGRPVTVDYISFLREGDEPDLGGSSTLVMRV